MTPAGDLAQLPQARRATVEEPAELQNILLVDDNPNSLLALEAVLKRLGQTVIKASSGAEALHHVLRTDFAVILLDVQMPGIGGFEAASLIRQREKSANTPIIFLTASSRDDAEIFKGYDLGAVDYLFKPIVAEVLSSKVSVFVELAKKSAQLQRLNRALEAQSAQLAAANRELESFSSSVSHDLRAPLRGITGFSQLLLETYADRLDDTGRSYLNRISLAGQRMGELIDDLLRLARFTRTELQQERVDLAPMARNVLAELAAREPERKVELKLPDHAWAEADARLVRVVLENLLSNAWKFTRNAAAAKIELGQLQPTTGTSGFFVRDNGAGFDPALVGRLFNPFQRLHTTREFPGTGIGLAIVERIISRHGGRVWADSQLGQGATFSFTVGPDVGAHAH